MITERQSIFREQYVPLADWVMGTSDLGCGLLGHMFNGYDNKFQKPGLIHVVQLQKNFGEEFSHGF